MAEKRVYKGRSRAPYTSHTMRIPDPIRPMVKRILDEFYKDQEERKNENL